MLSRWVLQPRWRDQRCSDRSLRLRWPSAAPQLYQGISYSSAPHIPGSSTYTSAMLGYRRSACSSRNSIHAFKNLLPLHCTNISRLLMARRSGVRRRCTTREEVAALMRVGKKQTHSRGTTPSTATHNRTYLPTVSESPITQRCLFGRVMATANPSVDNTVVAVTIVVAAMGTYR